MEKYLLLILTVSVASILMGNHRTEAVMNNAGTIFIQRNDNLSIHTYQSPEDGEMVCSHIIETANKLVVIDVQLLRPYAKELRAYVDRLGKPIDRVIITHSHPDHWFGLEFFQDVPIYSLPETKGEIEAIGDMLIQFKKPDLGDLVTDQKVLPTHLIEEGIEMIDGVNFSFTKLVDGESPYMALVELPDIKAVVAQDLVYNQVYVVVGEKNQKGEFLFDGWVNALKMLQEKDYEVVLAGHGAPTDASIFPELIEYIGFVKELFESGIDENELKQKIIEKYPNYQVLEMLEFMTVFLYHRTW